MIVQRFVVEKRQIASPTNVGWRFVYEDERESRARVRYQKSLAMLPAGWRIRLRQGAFVLETGSAPDPNPAPVATGGGYLGSDVDDIAIPDPWVDDNWIYPDCNDWI